MHKVKYNRHEYCNEYLRSDEWQTLRKMVLDTGCNCQLCKDVKATDVHHLVYRNLVDVTVNDLVPVCRDCHNLIHKAIKDGWISQDSKDFDELKQKTLHLLEDEEYKEYVRWLSSKHHLSEQEIKDIKSLQAYVMKKISALVRKNVWYDVLDEMKFTGRHILKIRKLIQTAKYRRTNKMDFLKSYNRCPRKFR